MRAEGAPQALGRLLAAQTGQAPAMATEHLIQALSIVLQRENARAVLRRLPGAGLAPRTAATLEVAPLGAALALKSAARSS